jgi:hypothetical protein
MAQQLVPAELLRKADKILFVAGEFEADFGHDLLSDVQGHRGR